jgi:predicted nuclease of predicted toxin-antitoxin system
VPVERSGSTLTAREIGPYVAAMIKLLIDNALSPAIAVALRGAGFDCEHVREIGLHKASDAEIVTYARKVERTIISVDRDFSTLLALGQETKPSLVLLRGRLSQLHPNNQLPVLIAALSAAEEPLAEGAVVIAEVGRVRVRKLPIS